ncbi:IclR family transcriptional regulator [Paenibacillus foliorum]|uniref:IclR family transcriptional regulator n=1 Tax=Paenibacillus foliorum TaxID=2654974 RepID=UPI001492DE93|nr:IclR family transcriptional regulator [Paenibacillus foliorum]
MTEDKNSSKYSVPALEKAFSIIEHLSKSTGGLSISELSSELNIPKTSVFSILNTMEAHNYVRKTANGAYKLGLQLYSIGMTAINLVNIRGVSVPYMEQLRKDTHCTVHLSVYDNGEVMYIDKLEGPGMVGFHTFVGQRKRPNTCASGKAVLAHIPDSELKMVIAKGLDCFTPNSLCTEAALREHLEQVRAFGYSVDDEEEEIGVRCVGAPIFNHLGVVYGAISVTTIKNNMPMQKLPEIGALLLHIGEQISHQLGYIGNYPNAASSKNN